MYLSNMWKQGFLYDRSHKIEAKRSVFLRKNSSEKP